MYKLIIRQHIFEDQHTQLMKSIQEITVQWKTLAAENIGEFSYSDHLGENILANAIQINTDINLLANFWEITFGD